LSIALREINSKLLNTEHVDPEVLAQEEAEMEQRRLAAIQDQQRYNAGYDNSFAGVYEETFEETAEVITEEVVAQADAAVVTDNQDGDDAASSEETVS
jgi:predicted transglutaminase-like protease